MIKEKWTPSPDTIQLLHDKIYRLAVKNPTLVNPDFRFHVVQSSEISHFVAFIAGENPEISEAASLISHLKSLGQSCEDYHVPRKVKTIIDFSDHLSHHMINPEIPIPTGRIARKIEEITGLTPLMLRDQFLVHQLV